MRGSLESIIKHMIKLNNHKSNISFPAVVVNTDNLVDGFIDVKPLVNNMNPLNGETIEYPPIKNVPVLMPSTKSSSLVFPVVQGDTVELLFQSVDIIDFVNGNTEPHDPYSNGWGNLSNVVAIIGFAPYQQSPFNPNNYNGNFNSDGLNIVHNKNTALESSLNISSSGSIEQKAPSAVKIDSPLFDVKSDVLNANSAVISTAGDVVVKGQSVNKFMVDLPKNIASLKQGNKGWSPVLSVENRGVDESVLKVVDWIEGEGEKPSNMGYIGSNGITDDIAQAINIKGASGKSGASLSEDVINNIVNNQVNTDKILDLIQGQIDESALGQYLTEQIKKIEFNEFNISKEVQDRINSVLDVDGKINTERNERVSNIVSANNRITLEQQERIAGVLEANRVINKETQDRIDSVLEVSNKVVVEQEQRIKDILATNNAISKETQDRIDDILLTNTKLNSVDAQFVDFKQVVTNDLGTQGEKLEGIVADYKPRYADENHYVNSSRSVQWTYWKTVAQDNFATNERITHLQSDVADSNASIFQSLSTLATSDEAIAENIERLDVKTGENSAAIISESTARTTADGALGERIDAVISASDGNLAAVKTDIKSLTDADSALSLRIDTVLSKTDGNTAAIVSETQARTSAIASVASDISTIRASTGSNAAAISAEQLARTDADNAITSALDTMGVEVNNNKSAISSESTARVDADTAIGLRIDVIKSKSDSNEASIATETLARTTADEALSRSITQVSAKTDANRAVFDSEVIARTTADTALSSRIDTVVAKAESNTAAITSETLARTTADEAISSRINTFTSEVGKNTTAIQQEILARTTADTALGQRIDTVTASSGGNTAAIQQEVLARTNADTAIGSRIDTVVSKTNDNTAAITTEATTRADADSALSSRINVVSSKTDGNSASITDVRETITNGLSAQAERIETMQADYKPKYADSTRFANASRGFQWTYWKTVAQDGLSTNERITHLQSDVANNNASVTQSLNTLSTRDEALSSSIELLKVSSSANSVAIQSESTARATADEAIGKRIDIVQSSTSLAQTAAEAAQTAANNAATAAGNKGEVIFGSTTPTTAKRLTQNLWIDTTGGKNTPKRWDGVTWAIVTDKAATDAATAASAAQATATEALGKANIATTNIATIQTELTATTSKTNATASSVQTLQTTVNGNTASIQTAQSSIDGIKLQYTVKLDSGGKVSGFGLMNDGVTSAFDIRADRFSISAPVGKPNDVAGTSPFMVLTNPQVIDGVSVSAGVYARNFYAPRASIDTIQIKDAAIKSAQIDNLAVTTGKIANLAVDTLQIAGGAVTVPDLKYFPTLFRLDNYATGTVNPSISQVIATTSMNLQGGAAAISFVGDFITIGRVDTESSEVTFNISVIRNSEVLRSVDYRYLFDGNFKSIDIPTISMPTILDLPPSGLSEYKLLFTLKSTKKSYVIIRTMSFYINGAKR